VSEACAEKRWKRGGKTQRRRTRRVKAQLESGSQVELTSKIAVDGILGLYSGVRQHTARKRQFQAGTSELKCLKGGFAHLAEFALALAGLSGPLNPAVHPR